MARVFLKMSVLSVSSWLLLLPVFWGQTLKTTGWLMRLLWVYEHELATISPLFCEKRVTLCCYPSQYLSGSSREPPASALGELMVTIRASPPDHCPHGPLIARSSCSAPKWFRWSASRGCQHFIQCTPGGSEVDRSIRGWAIILRGWRFDGAAPLGCRHQLTAMLAQAAMSIGLEVNRLPSPEPSRLDDWFLGAWRSSQLRSAPVLLFPEVHEELTKSWTAPFMARSRSSPSSVLTTLDGGAITWRNCPHLLSKVCKLMAALAAKAYSAAGQAASALHAMAILQVHQAKALKQMHEGSTDHFSTGYTPKSRNEHGAAVQFALPSRQRVPAHSAPGWTLSFYRPECP